MYLNLLNEQEKQDFLEIAYYAMGVDGVKTEQEKTVFDSYRYECHLLDYCVSRQDNIENIIKNLSQSSLKIKKIVLIELFGILLADEKVCEREQSLLDNLAISFNINSEEFEKLKKWAMTMDYIVKLGYTIINK